MLADRNSGQVDFDVDLIPNIVKFSCRVEKITMRPVGTIMSMLNVEASRQCQVVPDDVQKGSLIKFHKRLGHMSYDTTEKLARDPSSDICLTNKRRSNCLHCTQGKLTQNRQSIKDSGGHSPINRIGGVVCSDIKGPMTPKD